MSTIATSNLKNAASSSTNVTLNADGTTTLTPSNIIKSGTAVASTSGTSIDFTGIPSWVRRITVLFNGVSTSGTSNLIIRLGTSAGIVSTGYTSTASWSSSFIAETGGLVFTASAANDLRSGSVVICQFSANVYVSSGVVKTSTSTVMSSAGDVTLSGTLDRIRITTVNGTDTFDAGSINILYEG